MGNTFIYQWGNWEYLIGETGNNYLSTPRSTTVLDFFLKQLLVDSRKPASSVPRFLIDSLTCDKTCCGTFEPANPYPSAGE